MQTTFCHSIATMPLLSNPFIQGTLPKTTQHAATAATKYWSINS